MRQRPERGGAPRSRALDDARRGYLTLVDPTLGCDATFGSVNNDVVLIVALTPARRLLLVQTMEGVAPAGLELPAGFVDAGEPLPGAAARELYVETGYRGAAAREADQPAGMPRTAGGGVFRVYLVTAARPDRDLRHAPRGGGGRRGRVVALPDVYAPAFLAALRVPGTQHALDLPRREPDDGPWPVSGNHHGVRGGKTGVRAGVWRRQRRVYGTHGTHGRATYRRSRQPSHRHAPSAPSGATPGASPFSSRSISSLSSRRVSAEISPRA